MDSDAKARPQLPLELSVLVVYVPQAGKAWQAHIQLQPDSVVADAISLSCFSENHPDIDLQACGVGIFGKRVTPQTTLADGDRVEIYRTLVFDPKESRRRRARARQRRQSNGEKS